MPVACSVQLAPHTPWLGKQSSAQMQLQYSSSVSAVAKGGATQCSPNSAMQEAVGRAHGAEQSPDGDAACAGELWGGRGGWWAAGGSLAGLPARERPLGRDVWGTM